MQHRSARAFILAYLPLASVLRGEKDVLASVPRASIEPQPMQMDRNAKSRLRARRMSCSSRLSSNLEGVTFKTRGVAASATSSALLDPAKAIISMAPESARFMPSLA